MRRLLLVIPLLCCGATPAPELNVIFSEAVDLSQEQVVACVWVPAKKMLACLTPEELLLIKAPVKPNIKV